MNKQFLKDLRELLILAQSSFLFGHGIDDSTKTKHIIERLRDYLLEFEEEEHEKRQ